MHVCISREVHAGREEGVGEGGGGIRFVTRGHNLFPGTVLWFSLLIFCTNVYLICVFGMYVLTAHTRLLAMNVQVYICS